MTDRHAGYVIVLEQDIREDDAAATLAAIKQIRGVLEVSPVISGPGIAIAQSRAEHAFKDKLIKAFFEPAG